MKMRNVALATSWNKIYILIYFRKSLLFQVTKVYFYGFSLVTIITLVASLEFSPGSRPVDFGSMTRNHVPVRRLSRSPPSLKPAHYILTTEWIWYYKGDHENWIAYGQPVRLDCKHTLIGGRNITSGCGFCFKIIFFRMTSSVWRQ